MGGNDHRIAMKVFSKIVVCVILTLGKTLRQLKSLDLFLKTTISGESVTLQSALCCKTLTERMMSGSKWEAEVCACVRACGWG